MTISEKKEKIITYLSELHSRFSVTDSKADAIAVEKEKMLNKLHGVSGEQADDDIKHHRLLVNQKKKIQKKITALELNKVKTIVDEATEEQLDKILAEIEKTEKNYFHRLIFTE